MKIKFNDMLRKVRKEVPLLFCKTILVFTIFCCILLDHFTFARSYKFNQYERLIGKIEKYIVPDGKQSLEDIMSRFQVGLLGTLQLNPELDVYLPSPGSEVILPSQMILPKLKKDDKILINLAELRLYHLLKKEKIVSVYPVGIGQIEASTPTFEAKVIQMIKNPSWVPTNNIRKRYAKEGINLPKVVPSGTDNPMGMYAIRLSYGHGEYLIHGTNENFGIGSRVTSGCIRLRKEDIKDLFSKVKVGDNVRIINEPIKYSKESDGECYIEAHRPLSERAESTMSYEKNLELKDFLEENKIDKIFFLKAISDQLGIPIKLKKNT
ncbi:L,D-transpeptidase family protein [Candidatus Riesia pediculischaeffi]|nr:L,D-transpeptidase family protein [Candidatus Riesia pediculischaeffi]